MEEMPGNKGGLLVDGSVTQVLPSYSIFLTTLILAPTLSFLKISSVPMHQITSFDGAFLLRVYI